MIVRKCLFNSEVPVIEIEADDSGLIVDILEQKGHGYSIYDKEKTVNPCIVVDGRLRTEAWFTEDHMTAIEAHEAGHITNLSEEEAVAERWAINELEQRGYHKAANLLRERGIVS